MSRVCCIASTRASYVARNGPSVEHWQQGATTRRERTASAKHQPQGAEEKTDEGCLWARAHSAWSQRIERPLWHLGLAADSLDCGHVSCRASRGVQAARAANAIPPRACFRAYKVHESFQKMAAAVKMYSYKNDPLPAPTCSRSRTNFTATRPNQQASRSMQPATSRNNLRIPLRLRWQ